MSVIYKVITRPTDPRVPNSPKRYYPHLITLGQSVNLKYIAQKMQDRSSLSIGDIKSVIQNFVEKMKEQLLEGKSVNIEGLGVFMLTARSKGAELAKDINAKSVDSVRIFFQANKELRVTKTATRADEKLDLISLDEYLKKISVTVSPEDPEKPDEGEGGGDRSTFLRFYQYLPIITIIPRDNFFFPFAYKFLHFHVFAIYCTESIDICPVNISTYSFCIHSESRKYFLPYCISYIQSQLNSKRCTDRRTGQCFLI